MSAFAPRTTICVAPADAPPSRVRPRSTARTYSSTTESVACERLSGSATGTITVSAAGAAATCRYSAPLPSPTRTQSLAASPVPGGTKSAGGLAPEPVPSLACRTSTDSAGAVVPGKNSDDAARVAEASSTRTM